jgi:ANTAR domain-containing protein
LLERPAPRSQRGAFGRRDLTKLAKGILMERHSINEATAFQMLRDESLRCEQKTHRHRHRRPRTEPAKAAHQSRLQAKA